MTSTEAIQVLHDYLEANGPQRVYAYELARAAGIPSDKMTPALQTIRSREFIAENEWTIPYVGQGPGLKHPYALVKTKAEALAHLHPGVQERGSDLLGALRRWDAHLDYGTHLIDGRTPEGRWTIAASAQVKAMIQMAEVLGLDGALV